MVSFQQVALWGMLREARQGDPQRLIKHIRFEPNLEPEVREFIANWLENTTTPHREKYRPASDWTEFKRADAAASVDFLMSDDPEFGGHTLKEAEAIVARQTGYSPGSVHQFWIRYRKKRR